MATPSMDDILKMPPGQRAGWAVLEQPIPHGGRSHNGLTNAELSEKYKVSEKHISNARAANDEHGDAIRAGEIAPHKAARMVLNARKPGQRIRRSADEILNHELARRQGYLCGLCFRPMPEDLSGAHRDHIVRLFLGGSDEFGNLRMVHDDCHRHRPRGTCQGQGEGQ